MTDDRSMQQITIWFDDDFTYTYTDDLQEPRTVEYTGGVPAQYIAPLQVPLEWRDDKSGTLPNAMRTFMLWAVDGVFDGTVHDSPGDDVVVPIRDYLVHYVLAPCFDRSFGVDNHMTLKRLRRDVFKINTADDVRQWIAQAVTINLIEIDLKAE